MTERARVQLFHVTKCGFFRWGADAPQFGSLDAALEEIRSWPERETVSVRDTCPFPVLRESGEVGTYLLSVLRGGGGQDHVLTLWNETPADKAGFASIVGSDSVGNSRVTTAAIPRDGIPGYASYFYALPSQGFLASVSFQGSPASIGLMRRFVKNYLRYRSIHARIIEDGDQLEITGYLEDSESDEEPARLVAHFEMSAVRTAAEISFLRKNRERIRKLIFRISLESPSRPQRDMMAKLLSVVRVPTPSLGGAEISLQGSVDFAPSKKELESLLTQVDSPSGADGSDIGFRLTGDPRTYWLRNLVVREDLELKIRRVRGGLIDPQSLLNAMRRHRQTLLARTVVE